MKSENLFRRMLLVGVLLGTAKLVTGSDSEIDRPSVKEIRRVATENAIKSASLDIKEGGTRDSKSISRGIGFDLLTAASKGFNQEEMALLDPMLEIDLFTFSDLVFNRVQQSTTPRDKMKTPRIFLFLASAMIGVTPAVLSAAEEETGQTVTVKGEVIDMVCYTDSGASGKDHADCAKTCISAGLPVGLKSEDGKIYLLIGDHKPMNKELAQYAAQTITVKGKAVSRDGVNMIENAEIVK